jgi:hypothetical protein
MESMLLHTESTQSKGYTVKNLYIYFSRLKKY